MSSAVSNNLSEIVRSQLRLSRHGKCKRIDAANIVHAGRRRAIGTSDSRRDARYLPTNSACNMIAVSDVIIVRGRYSINVYYASGCRGCCGHRHGFTFVCTISSTNYLGTLRSASSSSSSSSHDRIIAQANMLEKYRMSLFSPRR